MGLGLAWVAKGLQGAGAAPWTPICPRVATEHATGSCELWGWMLRAVTQTHAGWDAWWG